MDNNKVIIKYAPGANVEAEKIVVTDDDAVETVMQICQGYESIYTSRIAAIRTDIEVICSDDYMSLPHKLRQMNLVGTLLYDQHYSIQGNICIVRTITDASGYSFTGFTHEEADSIIQQVDCFFRKGCDANE